MVLDSARLKMSAPCREFHAAMIKQSLNLKYKYCLHSMEFGLLESPPGSGKGTQSPIIKDEHCLCPLATGDMLRAVVSSKTALCIKAKEAMDNFKLVPFPDCSTSTKGDTLSIIFTLAPAFPNQRTLNFLNTNHASDTDHILELKHRCKNLKGPFTSQNCSVLHIHGRKSARFSSFEKVLAKLLKSLTSLARLLRILQVVSLFDFDVKLKDYLLKSYYKTTSLIATSTKGAVIFSGADHSVTEQMYGYGKNLGLSFQVADDILDFTQSAEQLGKPASSDLAKGNLTVQVINMA
ncbi:hypothetical protein GOBAR_AA33220 [Gossypium barbadense]|uniref:adenylate kinase n=1 Tax=Gossypium barbadense TaxID=3634 RepID=A0A2P5W8P1_GOSBA|nr:hypothetical protein GOBAR_AA33220 [Gossypium barbadense]